MNNLFNHHSREVNEALIKLSDALCSWERDTGRESVVIVREKEFSFRAINGKANIPNDITDEQLLKLIGER